MTLTRSLIAVGLFAAIGFAPATARCDEKPNSQSAPKPAAAPRSDATDSVWLFAVERSTSPSTSIQTMPAPNPRGSLILMELRVQRAASKSDRPLLPEADPRTKPLGW